MIGKTCKNILKTPFLFLVFFTASITISMASSYKCVDVECQHIDNGF